MRNLFILFFSINSCAIFAQDYFANIRKIGMEEGLSHYKVNAFYPDRDGMWIGTADGLNFFDGYNWEYWKKELGDFEHKGIEFIQKDQNNQFWLFNAGETGEKFNVKSIYVLDPKNGIVQSFEENFSTSAPFQPTAIQNFFEDSEHRLYFFTSNQLWRYSSNTLFELVKIPQGFEPHSVLSDGTFAGALENRFVLVSPMGETSFISDYQINNRDFHVLGNRQNFLVWQEGAPCLQYKLQSNNSYEPTLFSLQREGILNYSLVKFDEKRQHYWLYAEPYLHMMDADGNILNRTEIMPRTACIDKNGNLWIGKFSVTILRPKEKKFKRYLYQDPQKLTGVDLDRCRGITKKNGHLYVATYYGTRVVNLKTGNITTPPKHLDLGFVILKDREQHLWGAKRQVHQLDQLDKNILNTYKNKTHQPRIWSMFEDIEGKIWVGGRGLFFLENNEIKSFDQYNDFPELKQAIVLFIYQDKSGVIWVGSNDGLYQLDSKNGIIAGYGINREGDFRLPSNKYQHMHQDAKGIYWLATEDSGLFRWDKVRASVQQFDKKRGFLSNNIYSVYEDDFGYLWMSSFNGLIQFEKETQSITIYNEEDGINDNEFNRISHYQAEDGQLFFGGQNGVIGFQPKDFLQDKSKAADLEFAIKHVLVFSSEKLRDTLPDGSNIDLSNLDPNTSVIDLEMKISDPFWTDYLELHYTLQQLDNSGKTIHISKENVSTNNHIELFGMKPGDYHLDIKVNNKNGKQLAQTMQIPLKIAKPFTQTWNFWLLTVFAFGVSFWAFLKFRTTYLRKRKAELEKLVAERTEQVLKNTRTITSQAEQIAEMRDQLNRRDQLWLEQFKSIINERLVDPNLDLPSLIDDMDIGRSVFYEKVKTLTNMTPNQYIQELRLDKAKSILEEGSLKTVKEVSYSVGMNHPNYFSKLFKERFGISPSAYFRDQKN